MSTLKRFTLEVEVDDKVYRDFVKYVTSGEVFDNPYGVGSWAQAVRKWKGGGWIIFDTQNELVADKEYAIPTPKELDGLEQFLELGVPAPEPFYVLGLVTIRRAFEELLKVKGVHYLEKEGVRPLDADWAIQQALFGKQIYG
jgi:hypothetical protein